jgi:DNA excision repair protein ERCC-1
LIDLLFGTETMNYSLKYHRLHPEYIHKRIERLGHAYNLRILLLMCDVVSNEILFSISDI